MLDTVSYTYDSSWKDLLTGYDGKTITSDTIGNMLSDGTWSYTWKHGRQLASMSDGSTTWSYTYNADGLRTSRTNGSRTYTYTYCGDKLSYLAVDGILMHFAYGADGSPASVNYNGNNYYYFTNLQGDVIAIVDSGCNVVVNYIYDAWGNILHTSGSMASTLGTQNPLRYRGYVYDQETGLYYLQSRYYNPEMGRFICADSYMSTGQGILGNNMFAYCGNNPVNRADSSGQFWDELWDTFAQAMQQAEGIFAAAAGVAQLDSPAPGPADLIALGVASVTTLACFSVAAYLTATTQFPPSFSNKSPVSISDTVGSIASSFGDFQCKEAAESIVDHLKKNKQHGSIITITFTNSRGYIWSDIAKRTISMNGVHVGVEYNGMVYCNVHPFGLPEILWVNDFYATGEKHVTKIPF